MAIITVDAEQDYWEFVNESDRERVNKFLDYRSKDYQRIVRTEQKFQEWMATKKVQA